MENPIRLHAHDDECPPPGGFCRTHELNILLLSALYAVSRVLSRSLAFSETLRDVLRVLHDEAGLSRGLIGVVSQETGKLTIHTIYNPDGPDSDDAQYGPGEGIIGMILERPRTIKLARVADEPRFLNRTRLYAPELPFIAVPIKVGSDLQGVLAVQPEAPEDGLLEERAQFVEMVANLIGQSLKLSLDVAQEKSSLLEERDSLRRTVRHQFGFENMVGRSAVMRRVFDQARMVAKWNTTVLIRGETGTGKELIANAIHYNSPRARNAIVKLNCAALPENLLESELFGHERGAFTGAVEARKGRSLGRLPGQAAASAAGRRVRAGRRLEDDQSGRAHHCSNAPRSRNRRRDGRFPRGFVLSPQRHATLPAAAARAHRGHPRDRPPPARQDRRRPEAQIDADRHGQPPAGQPRLAGQRARTGELPGTRRRAFRRRPDRCRPDPLPKQPRTHQFAPSTRFASVSASAAATGQRAPAADGRYRRS
jgi:hypothetical protein